MLRLRRATPLACTAALLSLAACSDTMGPRSPAAAAHPADAPSLARTRDADARTMTSATIALTNGFYNAQKVWTIAPLNSTTMRFAGNGFQIDVPDNSPADTDLRNGYYQVALLPATSYTATLIKAPEEMSLTGITRTLAYSGTQAKFGTLFVKAKPWLQVTTLAAVAGFNVLGKVVVTGPDGYKMTVVDGGMNDSKFGSPATVPDGSVMLRIPGDGTYTACQLIDFWFMSTKSCATTVVNVNDQTGILAKMTIPMPG